MLRLSVLALVVLAFGALPLIARRTERMLHLLVAFATGIFLGVVFLHLLPEVAHMTEVGQVSEFADLTAGGGEVLAADPGPAPGDDSKVFAHGHRLSILWPGVLAGVLGLFLLENLVLRNASDRHVTVSWASLLGLGIHSFIAGFGLAAADAHPGLSDPLYVSLLTHKGPEAFSLGTVFLLAGFSPKRILAIVAAFALVTPAGALMGNFVVDTLSQEGLLLLMAISTGTFLFVALCDLLPEVFHHREDALLKVVLLVLGIALSTLLEGMISA